MSEHNLRDMQRGEICPHNNPKGACAFCRALEALRGTTDKEEQQMVVDALFTEERRMEKWDRAPRDASDRPVRYYRSMPVERFFQLLESGKQSRQDYDEAEQKQDPERAIIDVCVRYLEHMNQAEGRFDDDLYDRVTLLDEALQLAFPEHAQHLRTAFHEKQFDVIRELFEQYIPKRLHHVIYGGGLGRQFTPFIALSVGGTIQPSIQDMGRRNGGVYIEAVIPTNRMSFRDSGEEFCEGEKEVFTKEIRLEDVTSVVINDVAYRERFVESSTSNISLFAKTLERHLRVYEAVERWRWDTRTEDYLPVDRINVGSNNLS